MRKTSILAAAALGGVAVLAGQIEARPGRKQPAAVTDAQAPPAVAGEPLLPGDVIVGALSGIQKYGTVGSITGYSVGTTSCNIGEADLLWQATNPNHPVITQNLYRLKNGRLEHLGLSWAKHGFTTVNNGICGECNGHLGPVLGSMCSDPYSTTLNGDQDGFPCGDGVCSGGLGPRYEVNATTGAFLWPYQYAGQAGDAIYKRLQAHNDDINPALNSGALYYAEGHYVMPDDAAAGNHHNNASYRRVNVGAFQLGGWVLSLTGVTFQQTPALYAWEAEDPGVVIRVVEDDDDPDNPLDGRFHLGYRATDNGDGTWHYEYALYNMNSHRSAQSFTVPVPSGVAVTNVGFHDVDYHSGDGEGGITFDGTDWVSAVGAADVSWATETFETDPNANALRWGTLYNFRFDAGTPPAAAVATIGLFRPGAPAAVTVQTIGPSPAAGPCPWDIEPDGSVNVSDLLGTLADWGTDPGGPPDFDGDGVVGVPDLLAILAHWGACPIEVNCGQGESCFIAHPAPGCLSPACCETVCAASPDCCNAEWDAACVTLAGQLCGNCGDPGAGDCCVANGTPGCDDETCCMSVCAADAFCCTGNWDALCATQAASLCTCP